MSDTQNAGKQFVNKSSIGIVVLSIVLLIAIVGGNYWAPERIARFVVVSEIEREADVWQTRVLRLLGEHEATFEMGQLTAHDHEALTHFVASSDIFRLRLFDERGRMFWSSRTAPDTEAEQLGEAGIADEDFFRTKLRHGASHHATGMREARFIDGFAAEHIGMTYDEKELRSTSEIYIPVVMDGRVIGIVEHFRDVTDALTVSEFRLRIAGAIVSVALIVMWITAIVSLVLFQRHSHRLVEKQRGQERASAALEVQRNREIRLLSELNEWLQSCKSLDELYDMVSSILGRMFPDSSGSLYVYSNSRDVLEGACNWHGGRLDDEIRPDDCWGLRRGRAYSFGSNEIDFVCNHADEHVEGGYICIPIVAHGDTIGMMHLASEKFGDENNQTTAEGRQERKLALMCAEQISLAIANVRLRDELHSQSIRDSLTGLYNRRHFNDACRKQIATSKRRGEEFGLISFDVDHFKLFNDNHGHDAGDMVLRAVGEALQKEFDGNEMPCRTGGEEFTVLIPELGQQATLERAERLRKMVEAIVVRYGDHALPRITISAGVSIYPEHGDMPQTLLKASDEALYVAKGLGRNQVCLAQSDGEKELDDLFADVEQEIEQVQPGTAYIVAAE